ncbi:Transcription factor [Macleaya cordata]|uniref:Transcription factor n=1 Tax=Macleaya cordata TaxID=56857 RepID=A0A200QPS0_MACCD|nr:Transcription factor [Macleaya cordata]
MGKQKIDIVRVDDKKKRNVHFSKRRKGLFGKAAKFSKDFNVAVSLIVFSPAGRPFTFGPVDDVVDRILGSGYEKSNDQLMGQRVQVEEQREHWRSELTNIVKQDRSSLENLQNVDSRLEKLRENILAWMKDASLSPSSSSSNAVTDDNYTVVEAPLSVMDDNTANIDLHDGNDQRLEDCSTSISTVMDCSGVAMKGESKEDDGPLLLPYVDMDSMFDVSELFFNDDTEEQNHDLFNENDALPVLFPSDLDLDFDFGLGSDFDFGSFDSFGLSGYFVSF